MTLINQSVLPYVYGITANACFVTGQIFFKKLSFQMQSTLILDYRSFLLLLVNTYLLWTSQGYQKVENEKQKNKNDQVSIFQLHIKQPQVFKSLLKRIFWNTFGIWTFNISLKHVPLSIANALHTTSPILVFIIEAFFFNKKISKMHFILTFIAFFGVLMMTNTFHNDEKVDSILIDNQSIGLSNFYMCLPLISAIGVAFSNVYLHELKGKVKQIVVLEYAYLAQTFYFHILLNFINFSKHQQQNLTTNSNHLSQQIDYIYYASSIIFLLLATLCTYGSHYFRVRSMFMLPASKIMPYNYFGIILSLVYDYLFFGHKTNIFQLIGILFTSIGLFSQLLVNLNITQSLKRIRSKNNNILDSKQTKPNKQLLDDVKNKNKQG